LSDIPDDIMEETEQFFIQYNKLEGKNFEISDRIKPKEAIKLVKEAYP